MKTFLKVLIIPTFIVASCSPAISYSPTDTYSSITPGGLVTSSTHTPIPVITSSETPYPTTTPLQEISASDVGLPWNPSEVSGKMMIKPCYVFNLEVFHAGDMFYFPSDEDDAKYNIVAIADGVIENAFFINETIGWEINIRTPFLHDGKLVYYDVVHSAGLVSGLEVGSSIQKGDYLAVKENSQLDPAGLWAVDIGIRNGHRQANATVEGWTGLGYLSLYRLLEDDLNKIDSTHYIVLPTCPGNPIEITPFCTPTPDPYFGPMN